MRSAPKSPAAGAGPQGPPMLWLVTLLTLRPGHREEALDGTERFSPSNQGNQEANERNPSRNRGCRGELSLRPELRSWLLSLFSAASAPNSRFMHNSSDRRQSSPRAEVNLGLGKEMRCRMRDFDFLLLHVSFAVSGVLVSVFHAGT